MTWEKSKALTPIKRDFLLKFFNSEKGFFLSGGSALGIFYLEHRLSYDLDLFSEKKVEWQVLENELFSIAEQIGTTVRILRRSPDFLRVMLSRENEDEIIDFIVEYVEQIEKKKNQFGLIIVDTMREIGINKICTLISRCEQKDIIDLYFLSQNGFDIAANFKAAQQKDAGLDPAMVSHLLSEIHIDTIPEYMLKEISIGQLETFIDNVRDIMAELAFP